jgi:two-component sensor histidine kinase
MYKAIFLLSILYFFAIPCRGQILNEQYLRKNIRLAEKGVADTNQIKRLVEIGFYLFNQSGNNKKKLDTALTYFKTALNLSQQLHKTDGLYSIDKTTIYLGMAYIALKNRDRGKQLYMKAIRSFQEKRQAALEARAWFKLGLYTIQYRTGYDTSARNSLALGIASYKNAIKIYHKLNETSTEINLRYSLADAYFLSDHSDSSQNECLDIIKNYQFSGRKEIAGAFMLLSTTNRYEGNYNIALPYILKGIEYLQKTNDTLSRESFYGELALVYQELGQTENSIIWYRKTIHLRERVPGYSQTSIFRTVGFVVQGLIKQKKINEALNEILAAEKRHPPESDFIKGTIAEIKGYCYEAQKNFPLAEKNYQEMIRLITPGQDESIFLYIARLDIAKFYVQQKKYKKASVYLNGLSGKRFFASYQRDLQFLWYKIDSAKGDYLSSLNHFRNYKTTSDSLFSIIKNKQIAEIQIKYETDQKEKDIKLLKKDGLLQREKVTRSENMRNITFGGLVSLILFIGLLYNGYRLKQRNNVSLSRLLNEKDRLLLDKEWLIKEIHHRVKNNLQIVMGLLQRQSAYINNNEALEVIKNSGNRMHSIALIHQKLYQSESLDLISMPEYIDELISYLKDSYDLGNRIHFEKQIDAIKLDVAQAVPLGLILNEAITNAVKYAYAGDEMGIVKVALKRMDNGFNYLTIIDNGKGLPAGLDSENIGSLGLNLMKGLSKQLGGKLEIENFNGVIVKVSFKTEKPASPGRAVNQDDYL